MKQIPQFRQSLHDQLSDYITAIAWSSDHRLFAISAAGELAQWSLEPPQWTRHNLPAHPSAPNVTEPLSALSISGNGHFLAVGGQSGHLVIYDISKNQPCILRSHSFQRTWIDQVAWHPSDPILAVGAGRDVLLWNASQNAPLHTLNFQSSTVLTLAWHPQGQRLAVGGHGGVKIWDLTLTTAEPKHLEVPGASLCTAWSSDGQFIASGNLDRTLSVMDYETPPPWLMQGFPNKVSTIEWGRVPQHSNILAAAASDGITVWNQAADLSWKNTILTGHQGLVRDLAFQPNGHLLASAGNENKIRLWKAGQTFQQSLQSPSPGTHCLCWNPTGNRLATGGIDGSIAIFELKDAKKGFD